MKCNKGSLVSNENSQNMCKVNHTGRNSGFYRAKKRDLRALQKRQLHFHCFVHGGNERSEVIVELFASSSATKTLTLKLFVK